ncbi:hypothetical protein CGRA01v4_09413 [Colletotrichum graminicola]|nr:hypothetical protein CGRA01v4_09413 [Colletotrichum graminicola]
MENGMASSVALVRVVFPFTDIPTDHLDARQHQPQHTKQPVDQSSHTSARLSQGGGRCFGAPHTCGPYVLMLLFATVRRTRLSPNKQSQGERAFRHPPAVLINSFPPCTEITPLKKLEKELLAAETSTSKQIEIVVEAPKEQHHPVLRLEPQRDIPSTDRDRGRGRGVEDQTNRQARRGCPVSLFTVATTCPQGQIARNWFTPNVL